MRSPRTATKSSSHSPHLEKARTQQQRPNAVKKQKKRKKMCSRQNNVPHPQRCPCPIPQNVVPYMAKGTLQIRILRCGDYFKLLMWAQLITWGFKIRESSPALFRGSFDYTRMSERCNILGFEDGGRGWWAKKGGASRSWKGQGSRFSPLVSRKEHSPADTLI